MSIKALTTMIIILYIILVILVLDLYIMKAAIGSFYKDYRDLKNKVYGIKEENDANDEDE